MITTLITLFVAGTIAAFGTAAYLLPVLIGWSRHVPDLGSVAVINIALGWTLVGWVIALAMALRTRPEPGPTVQVYQGVPPFAAGQVPPTPAIPRDGGAPPRFPPPPAPGQDGLPAGGAAP
jgi:Superinfection immunity protein